MIFADTFALANSAVSKVKITYLENNKQIIPTIQDAYNLKAEDRFQDLPNSREATHYGTKTSKTIIGRFEVGSQYHYTMEAQTTVCVPGEDGMDVYSATQWMYYSNIAECLNVQENSINMVVRRLGGGYGAKISRSSQIACACALACHLTNQPVRFVMTIESNMITCGKRYALINEYEVEVDDNGKIQKLKNNYASDSGCTLNELVDVAINHYFPNCYLSDSWNAKGQSVRTDAPGHTWCRAPGTTEGIAMIENIMEHIAREVGKDRVSVRLANMGGDSNIKTMMPDFLKGVDYTRREIEVDEFNKNNRWRKRGIAIVPMKYPQEYFGFFPAFVTIYHYDGTVAISHGSIECGQGINTKVAQVAAHVLGIPYEFVKVKPSDNVISANSSVTGGSQTSEVVCFAVKKACEALLERLKPVRDEMKDAKWTDVTENGELLTNRTWTYKPPGVKDIPIDFRIKFLQKSSNPFRVLRSKATGEPAVCMSIVVLFALRHALDSARKDAGLTEKWFKLGAPSTPDVIFLNAGNSVESYSLQ